MIGRKKKKNENEEGKPLDYSDALFHSVDSRMGGVATWKIPRLPVPGRKIFFVAVSLYQF